MTPEQLEPNHSPEIPDNHILKIPFTKIELALEISKRKLAAYTAISALASVATSFAIVESGIVDKTEIQAKALDIPETCKEPSKEAVNAVENLLKQPLPSKGKTKQGRKIDQQSYEINLIAGNPVSERQLGQAMHRMDAIAETTTLPTRTKKETKHYLAELNKHLERYNVKIGMNPGGTELWPKLKDWSLSEEDKAGLERAVLSINSLPSTYVKYSGLKKVLYSKEFDGDFKDKVGAHVMQEHPDTVFYSRGGLGTITHEIYHLVDMKQCGYYYMHEDKAFTSLNKGTPYTHNDVTKSNTKLSDKSLQGALERGAFESIPFKPNSIRFTTNYGATNPVEDKAELFMYFGLTFDEGFDKYLATSDDYPTLRAKYTLLLARLYDESPESVDQILSTYDPKEAS